MYELHEKKQLTGHLERAGVRLFDGGGPAAFVDPHTLATATGADIRARRFVIACGGHARRLPFPGSELALTHSDVWGLRRLPRSVAIVGAAATGAQLASIFAAFGSRVALLELAPRFVPGEDPDISAALQAAFEANGITVITGISGVEGIASTPVRASPSGSAARRDRSDLR